MDSLRSLVTVQRQVSSQQSLVAPHLVNGSFRDGACIENSGSFPFPVTPRQMLSTAQPSSAASLSDSIGIARDERGILQAGLTKPFVSSKLRQDVLDELRNELDASQSIILQKFSDVVSECRAELESVVASREGNISALGQETDEKIQYFQSIILGEIKDIKLSFETLSSGREKDNLLVANCLSQATSNIVADITTLRAEVDDLRSQNRYESPNAELTSQSILEQKAEFKREFENVWQIIATLRDQVESIQCHASMGLDMRSNTKEEGSQVANFNEQFRCDIEDLNTQVHDLRCSVDSELANSDLVLLQNRLEKLEIDPTLASVSKRLDDIFDMTQAMTKGTERLALRLQSEVNAWNSASLENENRFKLLVGRFNILLAAQCGSIAAKNASDDSHETAPARENTLNELLSDAQSIADDLKSRSESAVTRLARNLQRPVLDGINSRRDAYVEVPNETSATPRELLVQASAIEKLPFGVQRGDRWSISRQVSVERGKQSLGNLGDQRHTPKSVLRQVSFDARANPNVHGQLPTNASEVIRQQSGYLPMASPQISLRPGSPQISLRPSEFSSILMSPRLVPH